MVKAAALWLQSGVMNFEVLPNIFQNYKQNIEHVELSVAAHHMQFRGSAAPLEQTTEVCSLAACEPGIILSPILSGITIDHLDVNITGLSVTHRS